MQPVNLYSSERIRPEVMRAKLMQGVFYGCAGGAGFAVLAWGLDGFILFQAQGLFPWLKLVTGLAACMLIGGAAGWLTARFERGALAVLFWLAAALGFAWLIVVLPLQIAPELSMWLEPELKGLVQYSAYENISLRYGLAFIWVAIFCAITGLLQLPTSESAVFSTSLAGRAGPALLCIVIMGINGWIVDGLNNEPLRSALVSVNETIQFAVDHQGQDVEHKTALRMHLTAVRRLDDLIGRPRKLIVGTYDQYLEQVHILVRFGDTWVDCLSFYNQPSNCQVVAP
jgi:hypothetical protein